MKKKLFKYSKILRRNLLALLYVFNVKRNDGNMNPYAQTTEIARRNKITLISNNYYVHVNILVLSLPTSTPLSTKHKNLIDDLKLVPLSIDFLY